MRNKPPIAGYRGRQWGQEFWQIINQWIWNLRLELGQHAQATTMRVTDLAYSQVQEPPASPPDDDDPPPDGTSPPVPPGAAPPSAETAPVDPATFVSRAWDGRRSRDARRTRWIGQRPTGHRTGRDPPLRMGFLVPCLPRSPMGRCAAQQAIRSLCKNAGRSATAPCACCMPPALAIAALVRCANSVKNPVPRHKPRRVSAVFWPRPAPPALLLQQVLRRSPRRTKRLLLLNRHQPPLLFRLSRCAGAIGHAVRSDGPSSSFCERKPC